MRKFIFLSLTLVLFAAQAQDFDWQELGEKTYANCMGCHQATGAGIPPVFPPLAGHLPNIVTKDGGREYLINILLFGLQGEISVLGESYNGAMPSWTSLSDEQIAAVVNYQLYSWGNDERLPEDFAIILPEEVAAQRDAGLTAADVYASRGELGLADDE